MAANKTAQTANSVTDFLNSVTDETRQIDCFKLVEFMKTQTGFDPVLWGPSIIGFGSYHYKYDSGREGDAPLVGFSPRKDAIVLYLATDFDQKEELLQNFGKHKTGKGCVYVRKLADVKLDVLSNMIANSIDFIKRHNRA